MRIDYHRTLIADRVRNAALHAALAAAIKPGVTTVVDIGAGTGLLGLMASRLGARSVTLYETAGVAGVAARILKANRARNCQLVQCHSTEMLDPERVDLVVSETLGNFALEENIIATMNDARARFLKPGGAMIPSAVAQFVAPVITDRIHNELVAWDDVGFGLDLAVARLMSLNNAYVRLFSPSDLLDGGASAVAWDRVDFTRTEKANRKGEATWKVARSHTIYGFAVWWEATLAPGDTCAVQPGLKHAIAPAMTGEASLFRIRNTDDPAGPTWKGNA